LTQVNERAGKWRRAGAVQ